MLSINSKTIVLTLIFLLQAACSSSTSTPDQQANEEEAIQDETPVVENPVDPQPDSGGDEPPQDETPVVDNPLDPQPEPINPEAPVTPVTISINDVAVPEDVAEPLFTVTLSTDSTEIVRVRYETRDGTALAGDDFIAESGQLEFAPGETAKHVDIALLRTEFDHPVTFDLLLASPENAELDDAVGTATLNTMASDDPAYDGPMLRESAFNPDWTDVGVFSSAESCSGCHQASDGVMVSGGKDVSPATQSKHDLMAHAVNDPYYQAVVADEVANFPSMAGLIEDTCLKCHAPMAHTNAHQTGTSLDADGFYRLDTAVTDMHAREGISCTACHQIEDDGKLGTLASFSGNYSISNTRKEIFGPFANPVAQPMMNNTQYQPVQGSHLLTSEQCATCHTLFTPTINVNDGQLTGNTFAEQTPFLEWQNSVFADGQPEAKTCQQCHMSEPEPGYATQIATRPNGTAQPSWPERSPFAVHELVGGNTHTLTLLRDYRDVMGIEASTSVEGFNEKITQTRELLSTAATVSINTPSRNAETLTVPVTISNLTGHKLPTSYPSRRMWLHLVVKDAQGNRVFESGRADEKGYLSVDDTHLQSACLAVEKDSTVFDYSQCYEPHRDVITSADQVAIYESVLGDVNGDISYVLLYASEYLKDNRIPPKGFSRNNVPGNNATAILGAAASDDDFNIETVASGSGQDTVEYRVDVGNTSGPFQIEAELFYQSVRPGFVKGLHADENPRVARYKQMYEAVPPTVELLAKDSLDF